VVKIWEQAKSAHSIHPVAKYLTTSCITKAVEKGTAALQYVAECNLVDIKQTFRKVYCLRQHEGCKITAPFVIKEVSPSETSASICHATQCNITSIHVAVRA
jgi:hypothetical protein